MAHKNYSGKDLSQDFKDFFRCEKRRLTEIFKAKGCTNIKINYGFYYLSGFFTSPTGQAYYFSSYDVRHWNYDKVYIRTVKDYDDYTGGMNQFCSTQRKELMDFKLQ